MIWDRVRRFIEDGKYQPDDGLIYWRERIIKSIYLIIIIFGLPAYILSMYQASIDNLYSLIVINTIVYSVVIILFLIKSISLYFKGFIIIILAYIVDINLIVSIGYEANGLIYFIAASVLSSLLVGVRGSIVSLVLNIFIFILFAVGLHYNIFMNYDVSKYSVNIWIITSSTTELICLISSIPLAISLNGLDGIITKQKSLQAQLKEKANLFSKAKQKAEEADNLKTKFLANMSHEVRTPLNAIMGFTELLMYKAYNDSEEEAKYLNTIHSSGTYLLNIIKNILDFSIIESGQLKLNNKPFPLADIISYLNSMYSISINKNSTVNILFKKPETEEMLLANSDIDRIKQILINLINNALKNQDNGVIEVGYAKKDTMFIFYVADEGVGIPPEAQKTIFKRFVKVEGKDVVKEGAGLGLPISKGIINALGGDIWVKSKVGEGSTFYFTIPIDG